MDALQAEQQQQQQQQTAAVQPAEPPPQQAGADNGSSSSSSSSQARKVGASGPRAAGKKGLIDTSPPRGEHLAYCKLSGYIAYIAYMQRHNHSHPVIT